MSYDQAKAAAKKILGDKAEIPDRPASVDKALEQLNKSFLTFQKATEDLEAKILDLENANSGMENALKQFVGVVEKNDFQLDPKADAKKIAQAQKLLTDALKISIKKFTSNGKEIEELDKHMNQLGKYKPPPPEK